jgi:cytochrome c peroxidase
MPPLSYRMMHWNHTLTGGERLELLDWIGDQLAEHYADPTLPPELGRQLVRPISREPNVDPARAELGRQLFHDVRLSGDGTVSCATCHGLDTGGTDQRRVSVGVGGAEGPINSPTVFNAVYALAQFWDGRAADLAEQADGPVNNPKEMASSWPAVIAKLERDRAFTRAFLAAYPEGYSKQTLTDAIAAFEATLVTPDSPFDQWLGGDRDALTTAQVKGWNAFRSYGCTSCHAGEAMGGLSYETMGVHGNWFGQRKANAVDDGRFLVTGDPADRHKFKVPTLRNVALTYPYLHDGSTNDLGDVVSVMAEYQCGRAMPPGDVELVVGFLNTLTGTWAGRPLG